MSARFRWTLTNLGNSTTETLTRDPIGWEAMTLRLSRDKYYHGVFTEFTLSLKWHCDGGGKVFIDNVYDTEDINGIIEVLIEIDCDSDETYVELYTGRLNLASYSNDGEFTTCNIEKSDLFSKLKARDEISVDLETTTSIGGETITAPAPIQLALHSQNIFLRSKMEGQVPFTVDSTANVINSFNYQGLISHQLTVTESEAESFTGWVDYIDFDTPGITRSTSLLPEIFEAIDANVRYPDTYTYRGRFSGTFHDILTSAESRQNFAHSLVLAYGATLASAQIVTLYTTAGYLTSAQDYSEAFDTGVLNANIILNYGDKVWLYWFENETITTGPYNSTITYRFEYTNANFSLEINSLTDGSETKAMLIHEAFNQVCDSIADSDLKFYSEFYGRTDSDKITYSPDGCGSPIAITNGLNIRDFAAKQIFCSLRDLFASANAIHNVGLTIETVNTIYAGSFEAIRVELMSFFYDNTTQTLLLTRPVKVDVTNDNTRYINNINIGYDKWETEFNGGLDEPCTKHEYSTEVNAINGQYNKLSKYIASGYSIELTRRKRTTQTTDWRYDNDNFFIAVYDRIFAIFDAPNTITFFYDFKELVVGDIITIYAGSTLNEGFFTINTITAFDGVVTTVTVLEAVANEALAAVNLKINGVSFISTELYSSAFSAGTGMTALTTAYNLRLTPARMLLAHMNVITAGIQIIRGVISFIKGEGNTTLAAKKNDVGCQEDYNESIPYGDVILNENQSFDWNDPNVKNITPLWLPETYKFEYPLTASQLTSIRANPHGYIQVTDDHNNVRKGFILDVEYSLKTGLTKFELLKMFV